MTKNSHTTLHAIKSSESMRGYYCTNADELATGCTAGEQIPWQQPSSQLWLRKIKKTAVSGEIQQPPLWVGAM